MRIDLYTKMILTVIAACLVWLCISGTPLAPVVQAQPARQEVVVVGWIDGEGDSYRLPKPGTFTRNTAALPVQTK